MPASMTAWQVTRPGPAAERPIHRTTIDVPEPGPGQVRLRVVACGVCRTDLHLAEGDLPPHRPHTVPGHEVVGYVDAIGEGAGPVARVGATGEEMDGGAADAPVAVGDRLGIAWLRGTDGTCRYCRRGAENLCPSSRYTGWDADGGYAQYAVVDARYAYRLPAGYSDAEAAPLLCAGIVGFRALRRARLPPGGRLGIYGFGASAHLAAQVALAQGARVHVLTRSAAAQRLALELGASSAAGAYDGPPEPLDSAILFAPVGELVPVALAALDRGGTVSVAGIYLTDIPRLNYEQHLFQERSLRSTTANTRDDGRAFLDIADRHHLSVTVTPYPLDAADDALIDLAGDRVTGAAVLIP
jgi:propanol-preferring alcohol dehydrogenase